MNLFKLVFSSTFILITALFTYGQDKKFYISAEDSSIYTSRYGKGQDMHLPKIASVKYGKSWRFWYDKYLAASFIIDVIGQDSVNCQAFITLYTYGDVIRNEQNMFSKVYYEQIALDPDIARKLYQAVILVDLRRFARKDTLKRTDRSYDVRSYDVLDGLPYTIEYSDEKAYHFKTGLIPENKTQFEAVINTAREYIKFQELKDKFEKHIPFGYYSSSKWEYISPKRSSKQIRQYKKYWKKLSLG